MTEIKAILRIRSGTYIEFYNANLVYDLGEQTHIMSGNHAGMWKVGDGITQWRNLPFSPRTAATGMLGVVAGSNTKFYGKIEADGTFTLNGIAETVEELNDKDTVMEARIHNTEVKNAEQDERITQETERAQAAEQHEANDRDEAFRQAMAAIEQEVSDRDEAIEEAIAQEVTDRDAAIDAAIATAELSKQEWLDPVDTKADLPDPATLDPTVNYLCRVKDDTETPGNNGVWQLIAGESEWVFYLDNNDFVDDRELAEAIAVETDRALAAEAVIARGGGAFTYVVDSDEALAAWANNTAGNDYTAVLIKPGTFTSTKEVNLTACGTKTVTGMPGSLLSFSTTYGLRYTTRPKTNDYRMDGVNVDNAHVYGFYNCTNLTNCTGTCTGLSNGASHGFANCTNLINCTGNGQGNVVCSGFANCTNFTNCTGTGQDTLYGTSSGGYGFYNCTNFTNCTGNGRGNGNGAGFYNCTNFTNCTGTGTGRSNGNGYSFHHCKGMVLNKPGSTASTTATYFECFVSISGTGEAPADTANGGWNKGNVAIGGGGGDDAA